jgi:tight adherence protein B
LDPSSWSLLVFAALTALALAVLLPALGLVRWVLGRASDRRVGEASPPPLLPAYLREGRPPAEGEGEPVDLDTAFARLVGEARLPLGPWEFALTVVAGALLVGGGLLLWTDAVAPGLAGAALTVLLAVPLLRLRRARLVAAMRAGWPEVIELMARAVRAGQGVDRALELVGAQAPEPWAAQFRACARQVQVGLSVRAAVGAMARRTRLPEVHELGTVLAVHRQTGGSLGRMLERLAALARDRLAVERQFRAATAGARFATALMVLMLVLGLLFLFVYEPDAGRPYLQRPEGLAILATAAGLATLGLGWVHAVLRLDD